MDNDNSTIYQSVQLGLEPTNARGTPVLATRLLRALSLRLQRELTSREIRTLGNKLPSGYAPGRRSTVGTIDASPGEFNEICFVHESIFGVVTPTLVGGSTGAYERRYRMNTRSRDTFQSYTVDKGSADAADRTAHVVFTGFDLAFTTEEVTLTGDLVGQKMAAGVTMTDDVAEVQALTSTATGGTFDLDIDLDGDTQTASTIAFDVTAGTLQTAIDGLSNVAPGDITVGGGPLDTDPITLTFNIDGAFAGNVALVAVDNTNATGGTVVASETTAGVELTAHPLVTMDPLEPLFYLDPTYAELGTTPLEELIAGNFAVGDKYAPRWRIRRLDSWKKLGEGPVTATLGLTVEADSQSLELLTSYEDAELVYLRIEIPGPEIEPGVSHLYQADMAVSVESLDEGDQDGSWGHTWGLRQVDDPTNNLPGVDILIRNGVATL